MSNPAVVTLASMNEISKFPYRFEIEDNIGEAIHIHYKDIRLDMTIEEFEKFADQIQIIFTDLIENQDFRINDYDKGNLMWLAEMLIDLDKVVEEEVFLEDILVDTYDNDGNVIYKPLPNSRVLKALNGETEENNSRNQINYFKLNNSTRQTNQERLEYDLEQIREFGYPKNNELILLHGNNSIIDGQHRAACLYFLYGNIKVPVRKMFFNNKPEKGGIEVSKKVENSYLQLEKEICSAHKIIDQKDRIIKQYQKEQQRREDDIRKLDATIGTKDTIIKEYQDKLETIIKECQDKLEKRGKILQTIISKTKEIVRKK